MWGSAGAVGQLIGWRFGFHRAFCENSQSFACCAGLGAKFSQPNKIIEANVMVLIDLNFSWQVVIVLDGNQATMTALIIGSRTSWVPQRVVRRGSN